MTYIQLAYIHLATILPAFIISTVLLMRAKGSPIHKQLGKIYLLLMFFSAAVSLAMPAQAGPTLLNHFGFLHLLSVLTLFTVPYAYVAIRHGNAIAHKYSMIGLYVGGLIIAGILTLAPGRMLHNWFFG